MFSEQSVPAAANSHDAGAAFDVQRCAAASSTRWRPRTFLEVRQYRHASRRRGNLFGILDGRPWHLGPGRRRRGGGARQERHPRLSRRGSTPTAVTRTSCRFRARARRSHGRPLLTKDATVFKLRSRCSETRRRNALPPHSRAEVRRDHPAPAKYASPSTAKKLARQAASSRRGPPREHVRGVGAARARRAGRTGASAPGRRPARRCRRRIHGGACSCAGDASDDHEEIRFVFPARDRSRSHDRHFAIRPRCEAGSLKQRCARTGPVKLVGEGPAEALIDLNTHP